MATHANSTPTSTARVRTRGAAFRPPGPPVSCDPPVIVRIRLPATLDGPFGRIIDILDAWDGDVEGEENHEGCCAAGDDDPADSRPFGLGCDHLPGEPDDAEAGEANDASSHRLTCVMGGVPA